MGFQFRMLTEDDYEILVDWWTWHKFPVPPKDCLPDNGLGGIMITKEGVNICAGFLYLTNSKIAWCEFLVRSYTYREKDSNEAIELLISNLCYVAKKRGYKAVFTSLKHPNLIKRYEAVGFSVGSSNTTEMTIVL